METVVLGATLIRLQRVFREAMENEHLQLQLEDTQQTIEGWDSFAHVKVIIGLSEEFGVTFLVDEVAEVMSVAGLLRLIETKLSAIPS